MIHLGQRGSHLNRSPLYAKPIWVTPSEAIRLSGIGRTMLYELIADGTIKSVKVRGKRLVSFASIEALGSTASPY
jgi:excisionase family DNA binding protein